MKDNNISELIKEKARKLFFSYGLKSVSMDEIANQCGISKKTIYQFFEDKNDIVDAVVDDLIRSHDHLFKTAHSTANDAIDEVLKQNVGFSSVCEGIRPSFLYELENSFPDSWDTLEQYKLKIQKHIIDNLHRGKKEGLYRENINIKLNSDLRLHQEVNLLKPNLLTSLNLNVKQLADEFTGLYLHAICTEKGKKLLEKYLNEKSTGV
jgi:AcrR family transcriptional regulator